MKEGYEERRHIDPMASILFKICERVSSFKTIASGKDDAVKEFIIMAWFVMRPIIQRGATPCSTFFTERASSYLKPESRLGQIMQQNGLEVGNNLRVGIEPDGTWDGLRNCVNLEFKEAFVKHWDTGRMLIQRSKEFFFDSSVKSVVSLATTLLY